MRRTSLKMPYQRASWIRSIPAARHQKWVSPGTKRNSRIPGSWSVQGQAPLRAPVESKSGEDAFDQDRGAKRTNIEAHNYPPISATGLLA
jgi:hypothetical protein